jgi:post-segregation antitoxin (ccd killing protein)
MKQTIYSQMVSRTSGANVNTLTAVTKTAINKAIQSRHALWQADNKESRKDMQRVYRDWYQVYRMQKPANRICKQNEVDTFEKVQVYLAPIFYSGHFCQITTTTSRAADALATKTNKAGKEVYLAPIRWTAAAFETAIKYCAKYYAGTETDIESKFNVI